MTTVPKAVTTVSMAATTRPIEGTTVSMAMTTRPMVVATVLMAVTTGPTMTAVPTAVTTGQCQPTLARRAAPLPPSPQVTELQVP